MDVNHAMDLLCKEINGCNACQQLFEYRKSNQYKVVPGCGPVPCDIMLFGEAPGASEAEQGLPFVGRAGKLLSNMLKYIGLNREEVFITNVIKCRPPNNRNPLPQEIANCNGFLKKQIEYVNPKKILCLGRFASHTLLNFTVPVAMYALRGHVHDLDGIKVVCTYHPSYLLRNPEAKKYAANDLKLFKSI